jgi:hypothetical protein
MEQIIAMLAKMTARMDANQADLKSAITQMEWEKPASVEMKPEAAHEDVPPEDAARMPVGKTEEKASGPMTSGRTAPPEEATETDPEQIWVPKGLGRCPQRDDPSCNSGATQENFFHKGHDPGIS